MPVVAPAQTVGPGCAAGQSNCASVQVLSPKSTSYFGCELATRMKAAITATSLQPTLEWTFTDADGKPINISGCGGFPTPPNELPTGYVIGSDGIATNPNDPTAPPIDTIPIDYSAVKIRVRETVVSPDDWRVPLVEVAGSIADANAGKARFPLPKFNYPGIYWAEAGIRNSRNVWTVVNQFQLIVNRSLFGNYGLQQGPPTISEIRLHIRDNGAQENELLGGRTEWDDAEIAAAIEAPILYFNSAQPPSAMYTTTTFPMMWRWQWLQATIAYLYKIASHQHRRSQLSYSAGGVSLDDMNKGKTFEEEYEKLWTEFKNWVFMKKVEINQSACWGALPRRRGFGTTWGGWW
jgi:hypothetical protein